MQRPQIWHYGLVARAHAELWTETGPEAAYYKKLIETSGQPALDLGCGGGRLLLHLLQDGLDVDGCDYSEDMLAVCQERTAKQSLSPRLYAQAMHELDLPRRYRTIFACGVIGLGGVPRLTMQAMQRCHEHLRPGGTFAFNYTARWNDPPAWLARLPEYRRAEPEGWPASGERQRLADGTELEIAARSLETDPMENVSTRQMRLRLWHEGNLIKEEVHTQRLDDYTKNELVLMLERAGFSDIQIFGDFSDEPATADHNELIFICRK
ncbi:class I SAM-dependent methyltransferase [Paenibacillus lignilyticus]|uniref:Class I SAM-dependent methyltransferase n=1 Tax=Paenibacillus lignilyticus TaxID=1172615 RepID=A0ABS5CAH8_9BACL|nr:class I SAM-dependent methyltransferase [Paenibacillus lignilyticus]MBP3962986.1 class I SAM-dependent methyltransferase [Paenibacillus lignilyticus]